MKTALVIVHLSSLDSFTADQGMDEGDQLAFNLADAIVYHDGPVIIVDQGWESEFRQSRPRKRLLSLIQGRKGIIWIKFDEDTEDWEPFLEKLYRRLVKLRVKKVIVGGIWYDPKLKSGCATTVYLYLRRLLQATVDPDLVGCE